VFGLGLLIAAASRYYFASRQYRVAVLNELRDDVNAHYGRFEDGMPKINCGPCARFAMSFRERWNARFRDKINLVCVMATNGKECGHVALKFADGSYFDGGNGVMTARMLQSLYPQHPLEEMVEFDRALLEQRVGGLDHDYYPKCPNYSDELTGRLIEKHLARLPSD
jgi:hypothetical protein